MYLPVSCANVASVVGRDASAVGDDSEDHEADASGDLDETDDEFNLLTSARSSHL